MEDVVKQTIKGKIKARESSFRSGKRSWTFSLAGRGLLSYENDRTPFTQRGLAES